jgi:hypothetical protein
MFITGTIIEVSLPFAGIRFAGKLGLDVPTGTLNSILKQSGLSLKRP